MGKPNVHGLPPHLRKDERGYFLDYYLETDGIKRRKRVRLGLVSFDLVKRVYAKHLEAMIENRFLAKKPTVTFDEAADAFMIYSRSRKKSYSSDVIVMRNLRAFFQGSPLENLTQSAGTVFRVPAHSKGAEGTHPVRRDSQPRCGLLEGYHQPGRQ